MVPDPGPRSFHEFMEQAEAASPASFRGLFIQYAALRKRLQALVGVPEGPERSAAEQQFFNSLTDQAQLVNRSVLQRLDRPFAALTNAAMRHFHDGVA